MASALGRALLTVGEEAQALARSRPGLGNKGAEAARAAVATARLVAWLGEEGGARRRAPPRPRKIV